MADVTTADLAAALMEAERRRLGPDYLLPGEMPANAPLPGRNDVVQRGEILPLAIYGDGRADFALPEWAHRTGQLITGEVQPDPAAGDAALLGGYGAVPNFFGSRNAMVPRQPTPPEGVRPQQPGQSTADWIASNRDRILDDLNATNAGRHAEGAALKAAQDKAYASQDASVGMANDMADTALKQAEARRRMADALSQQPRIAYDGGSAMPLDNFRFTGGGMVNKRAAVPESGVDSLKASRAERAAREAESYRLREIEQDNLRPKPPAPEITPEAMRDATLATRISPNQQMYSSVPGSVTDHLSNDTIRSVMRLADEASSAAGRRVSPEDVLGYMQGQGYNMGWYRQHRGQGGVALPYPAGEEQAFRDLNRRLIAMALGNRSPIVDAGMRPTDF